MIEILVQQPLYMLLIAVIVSILTGILKTIFSIIKLAEITYFLPYVLGEAGIFVYSMIAKIDIKSNLSQIVMNGVYVALLSGVIYQLYKQIKDVGLKAILGNGTAVKIYSELKNKMKSSLNAMTYAKRLTTVNSDDLATMVEVLRGSEIDELNLYGVANTISAIIKTAEKNQKAPKAKKESTDDQCS